jgi:hypothetical protein
MSGSPVHNIQKKILYTKFKHLQTITEFTHINLNYTWRNRSLVTWIVDNIKPKNVSIYNEINILYKYFEQRRNCL